MTSMVDTLMQKLRVTQLYAIVKHRERPPSQDLEMFFRQHVVYRVRLMCFFFNACPNGMCSLSIFGKPVILIAS